MKAIDAEFVAKRRADLTSIKPRKYPVEQYREARPPARKLPAG
jgi:hypothetical protein